MGKCTTHLVGRGASWEEHGSSYYGGIYRYIYYTYVRQRAVLGRNIGKVLNI